MLEVTKGRRLLILIRSERDPWEGIEAHERKKGLV